MNLCKKCDPVKRNEFGNQVSGGDTVRSKFLVRLPTNLVMFEVCGVKFLAKISIHLKNEHITEPDQQF